MGKAILSSKEFPLVRLRSVECPWNESEVEKQRKEFESVIAEWELLSLKWEDERISLSYEVKEIDISVLMQVGEQVKKFPFIDLKDYLKKVGEKRKEAGISLYPEKGEHLVIPGWWEGEVISFDIQENIKVIRPYPNWIVPQKPEFKPERMRFDDAWHFMEGLIKEYVPHAWKGAVPYRWEHYPEEREWEEIQEEATGERSRGEDIYRQMGDRYVAKVVGDEIILYKQKIDRLIIYTSSTSVGEVGIGTWGDKGYF